MYTPKQNRKNVFKQVHLQRGRDLFSRVGKRIAPEAITSNGEIIPMNMDKIDAVEFLDQYDAMQAERERAGTMRNRTSDDDKLSQ